MDLPSKLGPEVDEFLKELEVLEEEHQREQAELKAARARELAELRIREINFERLASRRGDVHFGAAMLAAEFGFRTATPPVEGQPRSSGLIVIGVGERSGRKFYKIGEVTTDAVAGEHNNVDATTVVRYGVALEQIPSVFDAETNTDPNQGVGHTVSGRRVFYRWLKTESTADPVIAEAFSGDFRNEAPEATAVLTSMHENVRGMLAAMNESELNIRDY